MTVDLPLSDADRSAILACASDYIESWLDGDADRMARALHPELVKRRIQADDAGGCTVITVSRDAMVEGAGEGYGKALARGYEASVLDGYGDVATVRVFSAAYMDYLHVARCGTEWKILNVLWQRRPSAS